MAAGGFCRGWLAMAVIKEGPPLERKVRQTDIFSEYATLPRGTYERGAGEVHSAEQGATRVSPQPQEPNARGGASRTGICAPWREFLEDQKGFIDLPSSLPTLSGMRWSWEERRDFWPP